jgi:hypothetical protein
VDPGKRFYNGNIVSEKPEGYHFLLQYGFGKYSFEQVSMPVKKLLMPGKKHTQDVCKRSVR